MPFGTDRLDDARVQQRLWTPAALGSQVDAWFDALYGPFTIATGVSQWNDISGHGRNATQATGANQPTISEGLINGRRALSFNGTSQVVNTAAFTVSANWTSFAIWRPSSVSGTRSIMSMDESAGTRIAQNIRQNATALESIGFNTVPTAFTDAAGTTLAANTNYIAIAVRSASAVEIWGNGSSNGSTASTGTNQSGSKALSIGADVGNAQFCSGGIGECGHISFDVSAQDRQKLEGYLAWKWGEVGSLPASHPFKNRPPTLGD